MARTKRICPAGEVFHVLNRAVARLTIFEKPEDYAAFMRVVEETWEIVPLPIYAMVAMPNHWHFVVRPELSGSLQVISDSNGRTLADSDALRGAKSGTWEFD